MSTLCVRVCVYHNNTEPYYNYYYYYYNNTEIKTNLIIADRRDASTSCVRANQRVSERESETKTNNVFIEHKQTRKKRKTHTDCVLLIKRERERMIIMFYIQTHVTHLNTNKQIQKHTRKHINVVIYSNVVKRNKTKTNLNIK